MGTEGVRRECVTGEGKEDGFAQGDLIGKLEEEIRSVSLRIGNNAEVDIRQIRDAVEDIMAEAPRKDRESFSFRDAVEAGVLVERVVFLRRVERERCVLHRWVRAAHPFSVDSGKDFDVCKDCSSICGCTMEEYQLIAENQRILGLVCRDDDEEMKSKVRFDICCYDDCG
jgi:hypothetical protein